MVYCVENRTRMAQNKLIEQVETQPLITRLFRVFCVQIFLRDIYFLAPDMIPASVSLLFIRLLLPLSFRPKLILKLALSTNICLMSLVNISFLPGTNFDRFSFRYKKRMHFVHPFDIEVWLIS